METQLMFLDCPAYLDRRGSHRCGLPAEVRSRFTMNPSDGPVEAAMIRCPAGHWCTGPLESPTLTTGPRRAAVPGRNGRRADGVAAMMTGRAGTGMCPGAGLPGAPLPGHRSLRQAGQVIAGLLLTRLTAAVVCVLLVVAAPAGSLGPHFPGPRPHPVPAPNPAPAPPGS